MSDHTEPDEQRRVYEGLYNVERPLTSAFVAYGTRDIVALRTLRDRRTRVLLGKPPKKPRAKKAGLANEVGGLKDGKGRIGRSRRQSSRKSSFIIPEAQLMHLPADVRAKIMADVKKLGESK
jgi:hypothetical protein